MTTGRNHHRRRAKFRQKLYRPFKRRSETDAPPTDVAGAVDVGTGDAGAGDVGTGDVGTGNRAGVREVAGPADVKRPDDPYWSQDLAGVHDNELSPTRITRFTYSGHHFQETAEVDLATISNEHDGVQWIDVVGLGDENKLKRIGEIFSIHPLTMEDIVHTHQRPKAELISGRLVVMLRDVDRQTPPSFEQISMVLAGQTLITFQEHAGDSFDPVRSRIRAGLGRIRENGADFLLYSLIDAAIDAYFPMLEEYGRIVEQLEDEIVLETSKQANHQVREVKRELYAIRKIAYAHRETMQRLVQDGSGLLAEQTQLFLRDCVDHATQILEVTESFREIVSDLRDLYYTQLSQRTNEVMRVLTIISTIFIPMSFVAGVYGMNFDPNASPLNMPETQWQYGYPFSIALMLGIAFTMLGFFWHHGWLKK